MSTPRGSTHHVTNTADAPARALVIMPPDIGPRYFVDAGSVIDAGGPPDRVRLAQVMAQYGLGAARPPVSTSSSLERSPA